MRELIRPTLFMIVRLGLFLAVVTWGAGQTWQGFGLAYPIAAAIDKTGVGIAITAENQGWRIVKDRHTPSVLNFLGGVGLPSDVSFLSLHVTAFLSGSGRVCFAIRHWFIVTIFVLFNGVLIWVYRKRPEIQPREV